MIRAVSGYGGGEDAFLTAANAQPLPGIELASAWYAFGKGQERGAHGWHFFISGEGEGPFALALRGGAAWACGAHDPEELGEFLRCVGAGRLTARLSGGDDPALSACPDGFAPAGRMLGLLRPYNRAERLCAEDADARAKTTPLFPAGYRLIGQTDAGRAADFLRQEGAFAAEKEPDARTEDPADTAEPAAEQRAQQNAAQLFARELDARAAVGLGYAALLVEGEGVPSGPSAPQAPPRAAPAAADGTGRTCATGAAAGIGERTAGAMVVTTAVRTKAVCLSALYLRAGLRGQGLGSRMVQVLAAEAARYARGVCLLCRPGREGFYARLGFLPEGEYACFVPVR